MKTSKDPDLCFYEYEDEDVKKQAMIFVKEIKNPKQRYNKTSVLRHFFKWCASKTLTVRQLSRERISEYALELDLQLSPQSVSYYLVAPRILLNWFVHRGILDCNPAKDVRCRWMHGVPSASSADATRENMSPLLTDLEGTVVHGNQACCIHAFLIKRVLHPKTRQQYVGSLKRFLQWCARHSVALDTVSRHNLVLYVKELDGRYRGHTVKHHLSHIRRVFEYLVQRNCMTHNPLMSVRTTQSVEVYDKVDPLIPKDDEVCKLFRAIDTEHPQNLRDRAIIGLMVYGFLTPSEIAHLTCNDYYEREGLKFLYVGRERPRAREIPVCDVLGQYLDVYLRSIEILKPNVSLFLLNTRGVTGVVERRSKAALPRSAFTGSSFRAYGLSKFLESGGSLRVAKRMAGHKHIQSTWRYVMPEGEGVLFEGSFSELQEFISDPSALSPLRAFARESGLFRIIVEKNE